MPADPRAVLSSWRSLLDPAVCAIEPMPVVTNPLWRVGTGRGDLVLKMLPEYPPGAEPADEFRVLQHVGQQGVPTALPLITDAGMINAVHDERRYGLLPYVTHDQLPTLGMAAERVGRVVGAAIGQMSAALRSYPWPVASFTDNAVGALAGAAEALPSDLVDRATALAEEVDAAVVDLPVQLTHGDCNAGNILVRDEHVVALLDFDHLPIGPPVRDLAYYLASWLRGLTGGADPDPDAVRRVIAAHIAGCHSADALSEREQAAVVPLMLITEVGGAHWALHGWERNDAGHARSVACARWLVQHWDELRHHSPRHD